LHHASRSPADLSPARRATRLVFLVLGIATGAWAPIVPFVKARLGLDDAALGALLFAIGAGALVTMPLTGFLIHRLGARIVILVSGVLYCLSLPLLALAPSIALLLAALLFFGASGGALDVAINAHAVVVEKMSKRPLMSGFHGLFSVGGLVGAAALGLLLKIGLPLGACAAGVAALLIALLLSQTGSFLRPADSYSGPAGTAFAMPRGTVVVLGILAFIVFLSEGAVLDWSAVFLRYSRDFDVAYAGIGYAAFSVAMAAGRLTGDRLTQVLGPVAILRFGALVAAIGFVLAVALPWDAAAIIGFVLVGLGASNIVPVLFSAAGRVPDMAPSHALPAVTTLGYAGLLAGPALIGVAADLTSLPVALAGIAALLLLVVACARVVRLRA
jgi:predicted MFS family arabinose efflux permease